MIITRKGFKMNRKIQILLVEDEFILAMSMKIELEKSGYAVKKIVTSGEEAVAAAITHVPDLILMDIFLSGEMNGIDAAQKIMEQAKIPLVIFLTGCEDDEMKRKAGILNPLAYLIKPILVSQLKEIIDKQWNERKPSLA
jgi:CheY-like chemotaxis protein